MILHSINSHLLHLVSDDDMVNFIFLDVFFTASSNEITPIVISEMYTEDFK